MKFKEKVRLMTEKIEECLKKNPEQAAKDMQTDVGKNLGLSGRNVGTVFNFVTGITFGKYLQLRRFEIIISTIKSNPNAKLEDVVIEHGYSERGSFDRAFSTEYGVTAIDVKDNKADIVLMKPLSLQDILQGEYMADELTMTACNYETYSDNSNTLLFNLERLEDREIISGLFDYQALYGITWDDALAVYSVVSSKDQKSLDAAFGYFADNYIGISINIKDDYQRDCLSIVVNYGLSKEEAEKVVEDLTNIGIGINDVDEWYLWFAKELGYKGKIFVNIISYSDFLEIRDLIIESLPDKIIATGKKLIMFYCFKIFSIICSSCKKEDILEKSNHLQNTIKLAIATELRLSGVDIAYIIESMERSGITELDKYDQDFIECVSLYDSYSTDEFLSIEVPLLSYEDYSEAKSQLDKTGVDVSEAVEFLVWNGHFIDVPEIIRAGEFLAETDNHKREGIRDGYTADFAIGLVNRCISKDEAYRIMGRVYPELRLDWNSYETIIKTAALICSLNNGCTIKDAEKMVMDKCGSKDSFDCNISAGFIETNILASKLYPGKEYRFIPYDVFSRAVALVISKEKNNLRVRPSKFRCSSMTSDELKKRAKGIRLIREDDEDRYFLKQEILSSICEYIYGAFNSIDSAVDAVASIEKKWKESRTPSYELIEYKDSRVAEEQKRTESSIIKYDSEAGWVYNLRDDEDLLQNDVLKITENNIVNIREYIFRDSVDIELIHSDDEIVADHKLIKKLLTLSE